MSDKPKHTPGPWERSKAGSRVFATPLVKRRTGSGKVLDDTGPALVAKVQKHGLETTPNANLIAAAPDLFDALDSVVGVIDQTIPEELLAECRAALVKARGE